MDIGETLYDLYTPDYRFGDDLLEPQRWCHRQWEFLDSPLQPGFEMPGDAIARIVMIVPLALATIGSYFLAPVGMGVKACSFYFYPHQAGMQVFSRKSQYSVQIRSQELYDSLKKDLSHLLESIQSHIQFEDDTRIVRFRLTYTSIMHLKRISTAISQIFGEAPSKDIHLLFSVEPLKKLSRDLEKESEVSWSQPKSTLPRSPTITRSYRSFEEYYASIVEQADGLCIGEQHNHKMPAYFLWKYMESFVKAGVDTLFMEAYIYEQDQEDLDNYFSGKTDFLKQAGAEYDFYRELQDMLHPRRIYYSRSDVMMAAKKAGIKRVVAIESEASEFSPNRGNSIGGHILDYQAKLIIDKEKGKGKYIIWTGIAHAKKNDVFGNTLPELCGIPSMYVYDCDDTKALNLPPRPSNDRANFFTPEGDTGYYCDFESGFPFLKAEKPYAQSVIFSC